MSKSLLSLLVLLIAFGFGCGENNPSSGKTANQDSLLIKSDVPWLGKLQLSGGEDIPFHFLLSDSLMTILNGEERIEIDELRREGDSLFALMPIFDSEFRLKVDGEEISGLFLNHARKDKNRIPFAAKYGVKDRFPVYDQGGELIIGNWEVDFDYQGKKSKALAQFERSRNKITGTFRTPTGDYRYLEGTIDSKGLRLSCFDGAHAFLFKAYPNSRTEIVEGEFWSGDHWYETWTATKNDQFQLPNPDSLTWVANPEIPLAFTLPDPDSNLVSFNDERFQNKVKVIQIMGSWCPNCMDESRLLSKFYQDHKDKEVEVVAISFETTYDFTKASRNISRLKQKLGIQYPVLFGGTADKKVASAVFPMLNHVMAYPTLLLVNRRNQIVWIHTGFSGPATGRPYEKIRGDFYHKVFELIDRKG